MLDFFTSPVFQTVIAALNSGFVKTLELFFVTLIGAIPLGLVIAFGSMSRFTPLRWLSRNTGAQLLLLLLATLWTLYHGGTERLLPVLPLLCYCLATMLLLCGQDARFFSFAAALTPLTLCAQWFLPFPEKTDFSTKIPEKNREKDVTKFS